MHSGGETGAVPSSKSAWAMRDLQYRQDYIEKPVPEKQNKNKQKGEKKSKNKRTRGELCTLIEPIKSFKSFLLIIRPERDLIP